MNSLATSRRPALELVLISALILFFELACIRWFPAHVVFLTFFTNTVLLACFVGMSVGCLTATRPRNHLLLTPLWLLIAVVGALAAEWRRWTLMTHVDVGYRGSTPQVVFFGGEALSPDAVGTAIPVELLAGVFFLLVALAFVGPGQVLGRAFNRVPDRGRAYALNLLGSVLGISLFALGSWLQSPPFAWFVLVGAGIAYFLYAGQSPSSSAEGKSDLDQPGARATGLKEYPSLAPQTAPGSSRPLLPRLAGVALGAAVLLAAVTSGFWPDRHGMEQYWSPYYRVDYDRGSRCLFTNLISHQSMIAREKPYPAYALPHLLNRDSGGPKFKRILIIGAGSGNDLARALQWGDPDVRIDAVEIDPVIQRIGTADHPNQPYSDPRVTPRLDDGRNFLRAAARDHPGEYDLIVYALVDSLVLHSGYSNIRLESYLFTEQAFADARRCLKPDGVFAVYNYFRQGWIVARLRELLRDTFANDPIVLTFPVRERVRLDEHFDGFTLFLAGPAAGTERLARTFQRHPIYAVNTDAAPDPNRTPDGFRTAIPPAGTNRHAAGGEEESQEPPAVGGWVGFTPATVADSGGTLRPPTDDWPFLYLREPTVPALTLRGMAVMALLSVGLMAVFLSGGKSPGGSESSARASGAGRFDARMFFLGAGFMLVETKAVVHMALLFGSTWMVNTVVFFAVLVMALLANLFVIKFRPRRLEPYYVGLFAVLGLNLLVPLDAFLGLNRVAQVAGACALVFAPIAFAGVIFATSFARSANPDRAFGWNVAGALAGGLAENFSMVLGFRYLLLVAVAFYLLSLLRSRPTPAVVGESG